MTFNILIRPYALKFLMVLFATVMGIQYLHTCQMKYPILYSLMYDFSLNFPMYASIKTSYSVL